MFSETSLWWFTGIFAIGMTALLCVAHWAWRNPRGKHLGRGKFSCATLHGCILAAGLMLVGSLYLPSDLASDRWQGAGLVASGLMIAVFLFTLPDVPKERQQLAAAVLAVLTALALTALVVPPVFVEGLVKTVLFLHAFFLVQFGLDVARDRRQQQEKERRRQARLIFCRLRRRPSQRAKRTHS